jgi:cold shock CspA family protein
MRERFLGRVSWYNPVKGYGWIERFDGSPNIFVHVKDVRQISGRDRFLAENQNVEFSEFVDPTRGLRAINVEIIS